MKNVEKKCKANGLTFTKCGKSEYKILALIDTVSYGWTCKSIKECKEAIYQALCLKKWALATA